MSEAGPTSRTRRRPAEHTKALARAAVFCPKIAHADFVGTQHARQFGPRSVTPADLRSTLESARPAWNNDFIDSVFPIAAPMAYLLPNCLILHIPKTGSNWVRAACQASVSGKIREIGAWHCDLATARRELNGQLPFVGTFVRSPLEWYKSAWLFWRETGRFPREREAPKVECRDFERFVRNCFEAEPNGYVSTLYERFVGGTPGEVAFIGAHETLADDLVRLLTLAGETFDEQALRQTEPRNVGGRQIAFPGYSQELACEVIRYERRAIERFGYLA